MTSTLVDLDFDSILSDAIERTGLENFGAHPFQEPLRRLLAGLEGEADLTAAGRSTQRERILGFVVNHLQFEDFWRRHPEIAEEKIDQPVVIIGLGRTGTTMLQRLLAADERFYSTLWWEARFPIPFPGESVERPDQRIQTALDEVEMMYETVPDLESMHPLDAMQADEEVLLLEQSFYSSAPESFAKLTDYAVWMDAQDQTPGYNYLKRLLQFLQWQKRKRGIVAQRWVLKTPHHIHYTDVLLKVFPDAKVVQTHRDPVYVIPSWASLNFSLWQQNSDSADPLAAGEHWNSKMATGMARCMQVRDNGNQDRFFDVDFRDVSSKPYEVLEKIYDFIGWDFTDKARESVAAWLKSNSRDRRPPHNYTLDMFGYTEAGLKQQYGEYIRRFVD